VRHLLTPRVIAVTLWGWSMLGLYLLIAHHPLSPPSVVLMPDWVPFWPWLTPLYLGMLLAAWALPLGIADEVLFRRCIASISLTFAFCLLLWLLHPTTMPRPPADPGWWNFHYRRMIAIDPPTNILPAAHGIGPLIGAWFLGQDKPRWRPWLWSGVLLSMPSIALVHQHRPQDIALGSALAALSLLLTHRQRFGAAA
jgi:hypothetical protein